MSNINEAFVPPKSNVAGVSSTEELTNNAILHLRRTYPWVLLISIIGFIASAILAAGTIELFIRIGPLLLYGTGAILLTFFCFIASLHLFNYAKSIKRVATTNLTQDLNLALKLQAKFWKTTGVLTLILLTIIITGTVFSITAKYL